MRQIWLLLSVAFLVFSCEVKPQEINYGADACSFCKMTIVDSKHAAEVVTEKGKAYKYDAIECMLNHTKTWMGPPIKLYLVTDYADAGELIDATQAHYLISEAIPSPMGAFLSSFKDKQRRDNERIRSGGDSLSWEELLKGFH